jgi:hypothetical protein
MRTLGMIPSLVIPDEREAREPESRWKIVNLDV